MPIVSAQNFNVGLHASFIKSTDLYISFQGLPMPPHGEFGGPLAQGGPAPNGSTLEPGQTGCWDILAPWKPGMMGGRSLTKEEIVTDIENFLIKFKGYEDIVRFSEMYTMAPPPPIPNLTRPLPMEFKTIKTFSEEEMREALAEYAAEHYCLGGASLRTFEIRKICPSIILQYKLETFAEERQACYVREPYRGGFIDGPPNGKPPRPWQILMQPDTLFHTHRKLTEVPHTASVLSCNLCNAKGYLKCKKCGGDGKVSCANCSGNGVKYLYVNDAEGNQETELCNVCNGDKKTRCEECESCGHSKCNSCDGYRKLKCFIQLSGIYTNHIEEFVIEDADLPKDFQKDIPGEVIFDQTLPQCWPMVAYPLEKVNRNSKMLIEKHKEIFPYEKMIQQRQTLRAIPLTKCEYTLDGQEGKFWVCGLTHALYAPDLHTGCCLSCQIL